MVGQPLERDQALLLTFADLAHAMVADYDVIDLAHRLAGYCVELLPVAAAGLLLTDEHGTLRLLASSNEQARLVELVQLEADQSGPCLESFRTGTPVTVTDVSTYEHEWPEFVTEARKQGFHAVYAVPMRLREHRVGALNMFSTTPGDLSADDERLAQALADVASIGIVQQRALARSETVVEQLQGALNSRITIEQAKGVVSERAHVEVDTAFGLLRDYARSHNMGLHRLAGIVLHDRVQADEVARFRVQHR